MLIEDDMDKDLFEKIEMMSNDDKKELIEHLQNSIVLEDYPTTLITDRYEQLLMAAETVFEHKMQSGRDFNDVMMRRFIAYKLREDGYTFSQISRVMGKNHSTIIHLVKQMKDYFSLPQAYKEDIKKYLMFHSTIMQDERDRND